MLRLLCLFFPLLVLAENPTIHWFRIHFPPSMYYDANKPDDAGIGYSDKPRTAIIREMMDYRHTYYPVSINRVMAEAKNDSEKVICFSGINRNDERETFLLYSEPFMDSYPNQLVVRKDNEKIEAIVDANGYISLQKLLQKGYTLSYVAKRSYSPKVDTILQNYKKDNLITSLANDISHSYLKQVLHRRVDATIEYPVMLHYLATQEQKLDTSWFKSYSIAEDPEMIKVYFACSKKSPYTEEIIGRINEIIRNNKAEFGAYYSEWLSGEQKDAYLNRLKP